MAAMSRGKLNFWLSVVGVRPLLPLEHQRTSLVAVALASVGCRWRERFARRAFGNGRVDAT